MPDKKDTQIETIKKWIKPELIRLDDQDTEGKLIVNPLEVDFFGPS